MAVQAERNQFLGVNPHLHSYWQAYNRWNRFHDFYNAQLMAVLKRHLVPLGYTAQLSDSLQIRRYGDIPYRPRADVVIRDILPGRIPSAPAAVPELTVPLRELEGDIDTERSYAAVAIYDLRDGGEDIVAWIEVLSPTNKGQALDASVYQGKRRLLLQQGMVFVEIDLLHETPPTYTRIQDYSRHQTGAFPYRIILIDPRPSYLDARGVVVQFHVDEPQPRIVVPLNDGDSIEVDFEQIYQTMFVAGVYGADMRYDQFPARFERYSPLDQARIATRMLHVLERHARGELLDVPPAPLETLPLEVTLPRLAALGCRSDA